MIQGEWDCGDGLTLVDATLTTRRSDLSRVSSYFAVSSIDGTDQFTQYYILVLPLAVHCRRL